MGGWGEICASGAPNDFSRSSDTLINLRISRMSPKNNSPRIRTPEGPLAGSRSLVFWLQPKAAMA